MKRYLGIALVVLALAATATQPAAAQDTPPPAAILPPAGNVLAFSLLADGDRIYVCEAGAGGQLGWVSRGPDAMLTNRLGDQVGRYSSGATWSAVDGSSVRGEMRQSMDAPRRRSTPWLLFEASSRSSSGIFSSITYVQEVQTNGGAEPQEPCTQSQSGQERRMEFNALYHFFIPSGSTS
jgi:hypothetical protein